MVVSSWEDDEEQVVRRQTAPAGSATVIRLPSLLRIAFPVNGLHHFKVFWCSGWIHVISTFTTVVYETLALRTP